MKREKSPYIPMKDAQLDELVQGLRQRLEAHQSVADAPELRMVHDIRSAYQTETSKDARSLERVLTRLQEDQVESQSNVLSPYGYQQKERLSIMPNNLETAKNIKKSRKWKIPVGVFAAVLFLALLVGGLLIEIRGGQASHSATSSVQQSLPTSSLAEDTLASLFEPSAKPNTTGKNPIDTLISICKHPGNQKEWQGLNLNKFCPIVLAVDNALRTRSGVLMTKNYDNGRLIYTVVRDFRTGKVTYSHLVPFTFHHGHHYKEEFYMNGRLLSILP